MAERESKTEIASHGVHTGRSECSLDASLPSGISGIIVSQALDAASSWPLKLIAGPQGPIVQVAARLRLLQEPASVENSVVSLKPEMSVNLPSQLRAWPVSDKSLLAIVCGSDQRSRDRVDSVPDIFPPLKNPVDRCGHVVRKCCFDMRMNVDEVNRTGSRCGQDSKVVPLRKKGIEGPQGF